MSFPLEVAQFTRVSAPVNVKDPLVAVVHVGEIEDPSTVASWPTLSCIPLSGGAI